MRRRLLERMVFQQDFALPADQPEVFDAAHSWVELADYVPRADRHRGSGQAQRRICAAGHKAMYNPGWGGYPDAESCPASTETGELRGRLVSASARFGDAVGG